MSVPKLGVEYVLPHEDVVLHALIHTANAQGVHPYELIRDFARRPAFMRWLIADNAAMHYSTMRQIIARLVNKHGVVFDAVGFSNAGGKYIKCRGVAQPAVLVGPSAR